MARFPIRVSALDRLTGKLAPRWTLQRVAARSQLEALSGKRNYDAATKNRRTNTWAKQFGDANAVVGPALADLRGHARDLVRNNAWARRGLNVIANNTIGWGIVPKAANGDRNADAVFKTWSDSRDCDANGQLTFAGLQRLVAVAVAESGEILIRRRWRRPEDGLSIPMQLEVLEADYLDTGKDISATKGGGYIIQGIEFDAIGRRVGYWLFNEHPGSGLQIDASRFVPASEILHVYSVDRPGQVRGVSWFAAVIAPLKDFDEYEDATLMRQKVAAMFSAFVTDLDGAGVALGQQDNEDEQVEELQPGMVQYLAPGKSVTFPNPPTINDPSFDVRELRRAAAGLGVTYEDLTGDYSQVNFSSARMSRIAHWGNVHHWQYNMIIPMFCEGVWAWAMEAAELADLVKAPEGAAWTCPPMPMIEPDKEGLALTRLVRAGTMTFSEMIRQQGGDPETHFEEYAADLAMLKAKNIQLDSNVADVSQAGLTQARAGVGGAQQDGETQKAGRALLEVLARDLEDQQ